MSVDWHLILRQSGSSQPDFWSTQHSLYSAVCLLAVLVDHAFGLGETGQGIGVCRLGTTAGGADNGHFAAPLHRADHCDVILFGFSVGVLFMVVED